MSWREELREQMEINNEKWSSKDVFIFKNNKLDEYEKQIEILQDKLDRIASYISDICIPDKSVNWDSSDEAVYNIRGDLEDIIYDEGE